MPKLIALAIIPALWAALWADLAAAEIISACLRGNTGQIIKAQIGGKPTHPCIGWQKPIQIPLWSIEPSPQELRRGIVLGMPVTTDLTVTPPDNDHPTDLIEVSGGFLSVDCFSEGNGGAAMSWFFSAKEPGAVMSVEGKPPFQPLRPNRFEIFHSSDNSASGPYIDLVPRAAFMAVDGSTITVETAAAYIETENGTCFAEVRVTSQDGEP